jgi:hypothetical protein
MPPVPASRRWLPDRTRGMGSFVVVWRCRTITTIRRVCAVAREVAFFTGAPKRPTPSGRSSAWSASCRFAGLVPAVAASGQPRRACDGDNGADRGQPELTARHGGQDHVEANDQRDVAHEQHMASVEAVRDHAGRQCGQRRRQHQGHDHTGVQPRRVRDLRGENRRPVNSAPSAIFHAPVDSQRRRKARGRPPVLGSGRC